MRTINHRHSAPALNSWRQNMEYHLATKRQAQINVLLSVEKSTLYRLCSLKRSHSTPLQQLSVFSGAITTVNILLPPLSLFMHFMFYTYYYFTPIPDKRENKRAVAFKTSLQEAVLIFPYRGLDSDPTDVDKIFSTPLMWLCPKQTCRNLHILLLNQPKHLIEISWQFSFSCIFVIHLILTLSNINQSCSTSRALRQHVIIQLNNTTAEADSSLLICAEFSFF